MRELAHGRATVDTTPPAATDGPAHGTSVRGLPASEDRIGLALSTPASSPLARLRRGPVRPLEPDDLPAVAGLYERALRQRSSGAAPGLEAALARMLDHPWAEPDVPSLVYVHPSGRIGGFLASHVRRARLDGQPLRLACCSPPVVDPVGGQAIAAQLMREHLAGEQDITIADGATQLVRQLWEMHGGVTAQPRSLDWIKVLRPAAMAADVALRARVRGRERGRRMLRYAAAVPDELLSRSARLAHSTLHDQPLTPSLMLAHHDQLTAGARLRPSYDAAYLHWLFEQLRAVRTYGTLVARMVSVDGGEPIGWFIAFVPRHGTGRVLQIAARPGDMGTVLNHMLLRAARDCGAIAVRGRLEPQLLEAVVTHGCVIRHAGGTLLHARDPDLAAIAASDSAFLTQLDGDGWMHAAAPAANH